jgi:hypothetical protein
VTSITGAAGEVVFASEGMLSGGGGGPGEIGFASNAGFVSTIKGGEVGAEADNCTFEGPYTATPPEITAIIIITVEAKNNLIARSFSSPIASVNCCSLVIRLASMPNEFTSFTSASARSFAGMALRALIRLFRCAR